MDIDVNRLIARYQSEAAGLLTRAMLAEERAEASEKALAEAHEVVEALKNRESAPTNTTGEPTHG